MNIMINKAFFYCSFLFLMYVAMGVVGKLQLLQGADLRQQK